MTLIPVIARRPAPARGLFGRLRTRWQAHRPAAGIAPPDAHLLSDIGHVRLPGAPQARLVA